MKTGYIVVGVVIVGGIVYLMMSGSKVTPGTASQSRTSNATNFWDLAVSGVGGAVSLLRPIASSGNDQRGPGDKPPYDPSWGDINGDGGITPDYAAHGGSWGDT